MVLFPKWKSKNIEAHMFWWHYKSPYRVEDPSKPWPIILWLQGGPVRLLCICVCMCGCIYFYLTMFFLSHSSLIHLLSLEYFDHCCNYLICETGSFRSRNREFSGGWSIRYISQAQKFYLVEESWSLVCGIIFYLFFIYQKYYFSYKVIYIYNLWRLRSI